MLSLQRRLLAHIRATTTQSTSELCSSLQLRFLLSTAAAFSIKDYLVDTCGLTGAQALRASKKLPTLKSASNPDAVLALLSDAGLSRPEIAAVVATEPPLLCARPENIAARLTSLRDCFGLPGPEIARFLLAGGAAGIHKCDVAPKLEFWIRFTGSFDKLLRIMTKNNALLAVGLDSVAKPNIETLRECGLSDCDIVKVFTYSRILTFSPQRVKGFVRRANELGVPCTSGSFKRIVATVATIGDDKIAAKMELLRSLLGCSAEKLSSKVAIFPLVLALSEEHLRRKIEFLISEVGLDPEYILGKLVLLGYSMEKRMVPRHYVVNKVLMAKGLIKKGPDFLKVVKCSENTFFTRYIDSHKGNVPWLADAYAAAKAGKIPSEFRI